MNACHTRGNDLNTWTATLDHHALDLGTDEGMAPDEAMGLGSYGLLSMFAGGGDPEYYNAYDFGSVLCSDSGIWPRHDYYFADGNGNVVTLIDTNQTVSASYRYDPFGNTTSQSGSMADANVYRFSSKEFHSASGLYYYGYRFYDPNLQRWLNWDPVGEDGGRNLFAFVQNDPLDFIDGLGLAAAGGTCKCSPCQVKNFVIKQVPDAAEAVKGCLKAKAEYEATGNCSGIQVQWWSCTGQGAWNRTHGYGPHDGSAPTYWSGPFPGNLYKQCGNADGIVQVTKAQLTYLSCEGGIWVSKGPIAAKTIYLFTN